MAALQRNDLAWEQQFERRAAACNQPPVPGGVAGDFGSRKADRDRPKGRTIVLQQRFRSDLIQQPPEHMALVTIVAELWWWW